MLSHH